MQNGKMSRDEFLTMFREDVIILSKYIPWFEVKKGNDVSKSYVDGDKMDKTLSFPVYDTVLLSFLNEASMTVFMDRNYRYFYTRNHIKDYEDELRAIEKADIMHMDILQSILSKYVMGGMTKAYLWKQGVDFGVFLAVVKKAKEIIEFWELPLYIADEIVPDEDEPSFEIQTVDVFSSNVTSSIDLTGEVDDWSDEDIARILAGEDLGAPSADGAAVETQAEAVADDEWSDEDIARILAEAEAEDAAKAAAAAEGAVEEPVNVETQTEAVASDDEWSDEDIARILAEAEAEDAAKAAAAAEGAVEEPVAEEAQAEAVADDDEWSDEDIARILAEAEAEDAAKAAAAAEGVVEESAVEEVVEEDVTEIIEEAPVVEEPVAEEVVEEDVTEIIEEAPAVEESAAEEVVSEDVTEIIEEAPAVEEAVTEDVVEEDVTEIIEDAPVEDAPAEEAMQEVAEEAKEEAAEEPAKPARSRGRRGQGRSTSKKKKA